MVEVNCDYGVLVLAAMWVRSTKSVVSRLVWKNPRWMVCQLYVYLRDRSNNENDMNEVTTMLLFFWLCSSCQIFWDWNW